MAKILLFVQISSVRQQKFSKARELDIKHEELPSVLPIGGLVMRS